MKSKSMQPVAKEKKKTIRKMKKIPESQVENLRPEAVSRFENYEMIELHRSKLKNAPYNPRVISEEAKRKLRLNIAKFGLMSPFIWNETTGNLVGGHQRLASLDALEGTDDYKVRVAMVRLTEAQERAQNIFLNNPEAQGDYDLELLAAMFKFDGMEVEDTGFDMGSIFQLFGDDATKAQPEMLEKLSNRLRSIEDVQQAVTKENDGIQEHFYCVVVFKNDELRERFLKTLGFEDNRYVDGRRLWQKLKEAGVPLADKALEDSAPTAIDWKRRKKKAEGAVEDEQVEVKVRPRKPPGD